MHLESRDPCTGEIVWEGESGDVEQAVAAARAALPDWSLRPLSERVGVAERFAERVLERSDELADLISRETGKPRWEAAIEAQSVVSKVDISIEAQRQRAGTRVVEGAIRQVVRHKPHGVLGVLGPYNFPAHLPNGHIVPSLLAGNTLVFKPSGRTPAVGELLVRLWTEAGLPRDVLNFVPGTGATSRAIAAHPGLDGLLFTGSSATGLSLHRQFAERAHHMLALEMGGNNPLIVWDIEGGDVEHAASLVVQSAYLSAGQRCTAARRLIIPDKGEEPLIDAVAALIDRLIVGSPFDRPDPFMGPVIDNEAADGLLHAFDRLVARGAQAIRPLERIQPGRPFLTPALVDVTMVTERDDEEYFGPLLQLIRVPDFEAALREANATRFGLAAGLIGGNERLYNRFWAASRAGVVNWNRPTGGASSNAPFGGVGISGNHRPGACYAADYCAWPVASLEMREPRAEFMTGLRPAR